MECLHRFCQACIEKHLGRQGQKECPKCRVKVSSRRALRADPAFDKMIQTFYPDIDAYEKKEEEFISRVNAESQGVAALVQEGLRRQVRTNTHSAPTPPSNPEV
jgi:E3 ubiquitin-protein ligase RNF1/2